jgi:GTP pyrophosphokinase
MLEVIVMKDKSTRNKFDELLRTGNIPLTKKDKADVEKAFHYANERYEGQLYFDGTPFITHGLDVALICMKEIGLGPTSAICSLLHDLVVNEIISISEVTEEFGQTVGEILDGYKRVSLLRTERVSFQSETFRKLFLSMVDDMRVILIRLAHDLNDLRHLDFIEKKRTSLIQEVKHLYTPIVHRLGLYQIKTELEERVMLYEYPEIFNSISEKIKETKSKREVYIQDFIRPFERELIAQKFDFEIKSRTKSVPSIWAKMKKQNIDFEEVYDLFAIRIIIDSKPKKEKEDCWRVYSIVTNYYSPNPKRLRDWISTPKASGYESLHTTVGGLKDKYVEVQIRTKRMDEVAEKGQASHWQYKGVMNKKNTDDWLSQVRDILENPEQIQQGNAYKIENTKLNNIFVFTPKGDLKQLPAGSTVLDFAFGIHTDVGSSCSGATVNNKVVPIRYELKNGDKVGILTSKNQKPKLDWLTFVSTEKARQRIKRKLKEEKYKEAENGRTLLNRKLKNWKIKGTDEVINMLVKHYKLDTGIDLYYLIAKEKLEISEIKKVTIDYISGESTIEKTDEALKEEHKNKVNDHLPEEIVYIGENLKNINYRMAKCCNPIRGDNVFGFVTILGGITIHRHKCPNAKRLKEKYPYRLMQVKWVKSEENIFNTANLKITGDDQLGVVGLITNIITNDLRVNMRSINFTSKGRTFTGIVSIMVKDNEHLSQLVAKINKVDGVDKVVRVK